MAEKPRFLRRHYPHQVQGVCSLARTLSASGSPALRFETTTRVREVKEVSHDEHKGHEGAQSSNDVVSFVDLV